MERTHNEGNGLGTLAKVALAIAIIGAINWGLIGLFNWNLVDAILGGGSREETSGLSRVIYALVGLAGLLSLPLLFRRHGVRAAAERPRPVTGPGQPVTSLP